MGFPLSSVPSIHSFIACRLNPTLACFSTTSFFSFLYRDGFGQTIPASPCAWPESTRLLGVSSNCRPGISEPSQGTHNKLAKDNIIIQYQTNYI
jgi:hypothetical protein